MTATSLELFRRGHLPVMGEWFALPLIEAAGSTRIGDAAFDEIFHPIAERVLEHVDGCLRIGGASAGADRMVEVATRLGKAVYRDIDEVPAGDLTRRRPCRAEARDATLTASFHGRSCEAGVPVP